MKHCHSPNAYLKCTLLRTLQSPKMLFYTIWLVERWMWVLLSKIGSFKRPFKKEGRILQGMQTQPVSIIERAHLKAGYVWVKYCPNSLKCKGHYKCALLLADLKSALQAHFNITECFESSCFIDKTLPSTGNTTIELKHQI